MKHCSKCDRDKPLAEFGFKNKAKGLYTAWCKECNRTYQREHYINNKQEYADKARAWELKMGGKRMIKYGLTQEQFDGMVARYDGLCWSCKSKPATVVDHDHNCCPTETTCGKCTRGILCGQCNRGIGLLGDNLAGVTAAAEYLKNLP